jgi:hypothetical protein
VLVPGNISFQELIAMTERMVLVPEQTIPAVRQPQIVPLEAAIAQIRDDSQRDPEGYLDETVTPFGGE